MYKTVSMCSLFYFEGVLYQNMFMSKPTICYCSTLPFTLIKRYSFGEELENAELKHKQKGSCKILTKLERGNCS